MKTIREDVGRKIGLFIDEDKWDDVFNAANIQGKYNMRVAMEIILILCKHVEALENEKE